MTRWIYVVVYELEPHKMDDPAPVIGVLHTTLQSETRETAKSLGDIWLKREHPEAMKYAYNFYVTEI